MGLLKKYLKKVVRRPYELPHIMDGPLSAPFVSFGLRMRSLRDFLTDAIKHMVFTAQDGPDPSKTLAKCSLLLSGSLAGSAAESPLGAILGPSWAVLGTS